jgi:hypothetical protein
VTDARFPERWLSDRRILLLSPEAFRLFVMSLAWSVSNRTDGVLYDDDLPLVPGIPRSVAAAYSDDGLPVVPLQPPDPVQRLAKAGLWRRVRDYWLIAVFEETQTTRDQLEAAADARRADRDRKRRARSHAAGNHSLCGGRPCAVPGDVHPDVRVESTRPGQARPGLRVSEQKPPTDLGAEPDTDDRPQCIVPGCKDPARCGCSTCWGHAEQEPSEEMPW